MCGIAGIYNKEKAVSETEINGMTLSLSHRGPDADGLFLSENVALGHRRLSIIDLSEASNQPFYSPDRRYVMVYNGEVYNFKEIAKELELELQTSSDTEVILHAFIKCGVDFVKRLNGMFSIAIYDKMTGKLCLFRDRMGIKPLYYYWDGTDFAFASELKALSKFTAFQSNKKIDHEAVNEFLYLAYIPEPHSIYKNVKKFPSGHYMLFDDKPEFHAYWKHEEQVSSSVITNFEQAKMELSKLIESSVKMRMISDVPLGTFLSGGTDSSVVTAMAQKISPNRVKTFSIGFKETKYNEAVYAKKVAEHLNTQHHEFILGYGEAISMVEDIIDAYDEPYGDSSAIPTMLVSKMAKQHVTVTLSGDGGDELFMGYGSYNWAKRLENPILKAFRSPIAMALSLGSSKYKRAGNVFKYPSGKKMSHVFSQEQYCFSESELDDLLVGEFRRDIQLSEECPTDRVLDPIEKQALFDMRYYLKDDLLVKVDRASMQYSLETRVPLLDHRIVEFALNVDRSLKQKDGVMKYLLKELLYDLLPRALFDRKKWGFSIPLNIWMKKELKYLIHDHLSENVVKGIGLVNSDKVQNLIKRFFNGEEYLYNRLWLLIMLHKFMQKNSLTA